MEVEIRRQDSRADRQSSAGPYYRAAPAWRRLESSCIADFHTGTPEHVGKNHKVRRLGGNVQNVTIDILTHDSFMAHPETLLPMPDIDDPVLRFVSVVKFYLSGWHIKPPYAVPLFRAVSMLISLKWRQEASKSNPRRNLHLLLGISGPYQRLLHIRANLSPSAQIQLLLYGSRSPHPN